MFFYTKSKEEVLNSLSSIDGLSQNGIEQSQLKYGNNTISRPKDKPFYKRLFSALTEPMVLILVFSAVITFGINLGQFLKTGQADFLEVIGIVVAILLSVVITLFMEGSSKKAFDALRKLNKDVEVKTIRNGKLAIVSQRDIVVGDIIILSAGDKVVADGRLIDSQSLSVDESALTGESTPSKKDCSVVLSKDTHLAERLNMVYSGTFVTSGAGKYVVTGVGNLTEIGKVANELGDKPTTVSPLEQKLNKLSKVVSITGAIISGIIFFITIIRLAIIGNFNFFNVQNAFISAIVLIVAAVPEGLPSIVAVSLALNMIKLAKNNALIKKLTATETMGAVSVICSDKTGTLTENKMKVIKICLSDYCDLPEKVKNEILFENFCINSTAVVTDMFKRNEKFVGSQSEVALLKSYKKVTGFDYQDKRKLAKIIKTVPFSSVEKKMETYVKLGNGVRKYVKGAPEVVLSLCDLTDTEIDKLLSKLENFEKSAKRVLCFAHVDIDSIDEDKKLVFDGFAIISDGIRKEAYSAVKSAKKAGIDVIMLTGDNILTATAVAKELKIIDNDDSALLATDIEKLSDSDLYKTLKKVKVIARSTPSTKLRVVKVLKNYGEVVAVTGDGINDAPAIKNADIGIAMGVSGTELTKETADTILLDDSFSTIINAIKFGRNVYLNIQRFILFQLSVNVSALLFIVASILFGFKTPFNTLQLLWINVIMDGPPALTLGLEPPSNSVMCSLPVKRNESIVKKASLLRIIFSGFYIATITLLQYRFNFLSVGNKEVLSATFSLFILFQTFNAFNSRKLSLESIFKDFTKNKIMLITFAVTFLMQFFIVTFMYNIFGVSPMCALSWLKVVLTALSIVVTSEGYKIFHRLVFKKRRLINKKGV
jgi:Ca2+-transporting ATPase